MKKKKTPKAHDPVSLERMLSSLSAEARDLERMRIAAWLLGQAIRSAEKGDLATAAVVETLARRVRAGMLDLSEGSE